MSLGFATKIQPTVAEARELIPEGRRAYVDARDALYSSRWQKNDKSKADIRAAAIFALHQAQVEGVLEPPLPDDIAEAVANLADHVDPGELLPWNDFNSPAAKYVLDAVVEHGFRSDSMEVING